LKVLEINSMQALDVVVAKCLQTLPVEARTFLNATVAKVLGSMDHFVDRSSIVHHFLWDTTLQTHTHNIMVVVVVGGGACTGWKRDHRSSHLVDASSTQRGTLHDTHLYVTSGEKRKKVGAGDGCTLRMNSMPTLAPHCAALLADAIPPLPPPITYDS
jgi:hypothetical protein